MWGRVPRRSPRFVEMFHDDYAGDPSRAARHYTDPASIKYRNEAEILGRAENPEREYIERVLPEKLRLGKEYAKNSSLWLDFVRYLKNFTCRRTPREGSKGRSILLLRIHPTADGIMETEASSFG